MDCSEILGVTKIALYSNIDVKFHYPDITNINEIDTINHGGLSIVIEYNELPTWRRDTQNSANYIQSFIDIFQFYLHGIENETPEILRLLLESRDGFIVEIITKGGDSYVFKTPVFISKKLTKKENERTWKVVLSYREPTKHDFLIKTNSLLMTHSFIKVGDNPLQVLGTEKGEAIVTEPKQIQI